MKFNKNSIYKHILKFFLQVARIFVEVYLYLTRRSDNMVEMSNIHRLYHYTTYNVIKNNKNYKVVFSSEVREDIERHILDFKQNGDVCLAAKNVIVNCHLTREGTFTDEDSCDLLDITEYVRYFCYYFDKSEKFDIFLNYLEYEHGIDLSLYKDIILYMNDFDFTEKVYDIKTVKDTMFRDIFI